MTRFVGAVVLGLALSGCTASMVGATTLTVGLAGALSYQCPGWVDVRLRDELTGGELCGEPVVLLSGDDRRMAKTCAPVPLSAGTWEVRAVRGGAPSTLVIEKVEHCEHQAYSIELTLPGPTR